MANSYLEGDRAGVGEQPVVDETTHDLAHVSGQGAQGLGQRVGQGANLSDPRMGDGGALGGRQRRFGGLGSLRSGHAFLVVLPPPDRRERLRVTRRLAALGSSYKTNALACVPTLA